MASGALGTPPGEPTLPGLASDVVATISHELRQPLASIRGFSEMLLAHWGDFAEADKIEMLKGILHDSLRVGRLVDELLELARLESSEITLHRHPTDIAQLINGVVTNLKVSYPSLDATTELGPELPKVLVDQFRLEQVLTNIVENACKYASAGTVHIKGSLRTYQGRDVVEVEISDQGGGIAPEELPRVTEKFFRSAEAEGNGLGLGLWISRGIVEAHGGELVATSAVGEGTTVRFTVPVGDAPEAQGPKDGAHKISRRDRARTGKLAGS